MEVFYSQGQLVNVLSKYFEFKWIKGCFVFEDYHAKITIYPSGKYYVSGKRWKPVKQMVDKLVAEYALSDKVGYRLNRYTKNKRD